MLSSCVRLSVRPSVACQYCTKTAKRRIMQITPYDSAWTLSFVMPKILTKFQQGHPQRLRQIEVG